MNSKYEHCDCIMQMYLVNGAMHTSWEEYFFVFFNSRAVAH